MPTTSGFQARFSDALRLALIYRLSHELNAELSSKEVLRRVLNATAEALGTPHASIMVLRDNMLQTAYALGGGRDIDPHPVMQRVLADGLAGFVAHNYRTVVINDITSNPLWMPLPGEPFSPQTGSALCVPLIHAGDVVGVMTLAHPVHSYFTADAVNLTNAISEMGAAALANTLLLEDARRANLRYSHLFDDVIVPVILTDLCGDIQSLNRSAAEFLGYAPDELRMQRITLVHPDGTGPLRGDAYSQLTRGREVRFRSVVVTKSGERLPVQVFVKRIHNNLGEDYVQWIEHDLTSELALDRLRQDLAAMLYHDMRGPLGNIYTSVTALKTLLDDYGDPDIENLLGIAARSQQQVQQMVESLLDVQRLEQGSKLLNRSNTTVNELIEGALQLIQPAAEDKHIRMRLALGDALPMLYIDSGMIVRVIANLLDNAIKYSPDYGVVTVTTASSCDEVFFRFKDTGPGIPAEALEHIFDKFARVRQRNMPYGVGLGLAFCKLAVDAHGGRIWVRSNPQNGSVFTFALPIEAPATSELPLLGAATF